MIKRNRVLQVAMCVAVALVPAGMLLAQEATVITGGGEAVIMKSSSGPVEIRSSGRSFSPPPGAMPARPPSPDQPPKKPPSEPPSKSPSKPGEEKEKEKGKPGEEKKSEGDSETVKRPTTPPEAADPEIIRNMRLDEDGKVQLNFTGHPWPDVLRWLAQLSGLSLDWQELPGDYLNLITQKKYTLGEVRDMINRHLLARGYTMIRQEETLWVVKIEKLNPSMVPRVEPDELDKRDAHEFVKVNFALKWMMAHQAVEELKPLLSSHAKLTPLSTSNRVEAMDAVINLRELRRFLEDEQSTESQEELVREFPLKYTRAEDIRAHVLALLGMPVSSGGGRRPSAGGSSQAMQQMQQQMQKQMAEQMKKMQQMAAQAAAAAKKTGGGGMPRPPEGRVSLIVNQRKNSILARAPPDKMVIIAQTITALDVSGSDSPADYVARHQVYRLETIDPAPVVKTLEEMGDLDPRTRLEVDTVNRAIIAYANLLDHATIQMLVSKLDGGGRRCHVIPLEKLRAESVAETVTFMMGGGKKEESNSSERSRGYNPFGFSFGYPSSRGSSRPQGSDQFRVEPDVRNNALVLWANEFEVKKVEELLEELRQLPPREGEAYTAHVYRLASIDPEAVVKTLTDMDTLGPRATLEVDAPNKAIIAYASADEHKKISDLLQKLDGSARDFFVRHLRRLEADSVAGTIEFMFGGGEKKDEYLSRYDYYPYTDRMRPNAGDTDKFRVDADLEFNRLLIWANEPELKAVENLLVKLGEIPEEGGSPDTVRVLDTGGGAELEALIERIRRTWTGPNPLIVIPPEESEETAPEEQPGGPAASPPRDTTAGMTQRPLFRLVRFSPDDGAAEVSRDPVEVDTGAEIAPAPAPGVETPPAAGVETPPALGKADAGAETPSGPASSGPGADAPAVPPESAPGASASPGPAEGAGKPPAPVRISWGPDGRVIIACEDPKVLDALEDVLNRHAPPRQDYKVFQLKYALATWVAYNLEDFFEEKEQQGAGGGRYYDPYWGGYRYGNPNTGKEGARLSKRRPVKFISDSDTNTILVQNADQGQLKTIEDLIKLYDAPEPPDTQSLRKTEIVPLSYSKATVVEKALKDVYADLLSPNDRRLKEGQPKPDRSVTINLGDGDSVTKYPRWKGQLSIGVDELSNSLIISAPTYLFDDVKAKITALDEAARPVSTVRVMKIDGRLSAAGLQAKLSEIMGGGSGRRPPSGRSSSPSRPPAGPPRPPGPSRTRSSGGGSYSR